MKWHWAPDFRENAPQWMADCHHEISDEELMGIVNRNGQEWITTSEVVAEYLDKSGYKDRSDLRDFLSDDRYGHLDATLAQRVVDRLRQMVDRKDLIGEGNWGMPPAHPRFTRLKCT